MKAILKPCALGAIFGLLFLCSCTTTRPPLPLDVSMNPEAGLGDPGDWLIAMVRVDGGEPLPFIVDTGCPVTCLDQSLEPKLGKHLGDAHFLNLGVRHPGSVYHVPELRLGNTPLRDSSAFVVTTDCRGLSKNAHVPVIGFLGMDVLKYYCVQLNFQSGQVRFLDGEHADKSTWGKPFHLSNIGDGCISVAENFVGAKGPPSMVDTGTDYDGVLVAKLFQQWTNHMMPSAPGEVHSPNGTLGGEIYHELDLSRMPAADCDFHTRFNVIGLHVLSENLVTFDFPKRTMYLKRTSDWPLASKDKEAVGAAAEKSAIDVLENLEKKGRLPGWHQHERRVPAAVYHFSHTSAGDVITFDMQKTGEPSVYHYTFSRASSTSLWDLQKAWLTDPDGKTIEKFPSPKAAG